MTALWLCWLLTCQVRATPVQAAPPTAEAMRVYWVQRLAVAHGVDPELALAVSRAENWSADSMAHGQHGETSIMQILPSNVGRFAHCGTNMHSMRTSACYGVHLLAECLQHSVGNRVRALRCYNGSATEAQAYRYLDAVERARLRNP